MPYYVYITTSRNNTALYTGVTNDLKRRLAEHKRGRGSAFAEKYKATKLVHYEVFERILEAIQREKQIKAGSRQKKIDLIRKTNRIWTDLGNEI